jgi:predicted transcriptional regulator YdeE
MTLSDNKGDSEVETKIFERPEFEFYPEAFNPEDGSSELQLWVPVKRG